MSREIVSIAKDKLTPFVSQRGPDGRCDIDKDLIRVECLATANEFSRITTERVFGPYGVYRWKALAKNINALTYMYMGFYGGLQGSIEFRAIGTSRRCYSTPNEVQSTSTTLATGERTDWSILKNFSIDWRSDRIYFYINGTLEATHYNNIPSRAMPFFMRVSQQAAPPLRAGLHLKRQSLERVT